MEFLNTVFDVIFSHEGWISGSFTRDCLLLEEPISKERDIDVIVPFSTDEKQNNAESLRDELIHKFNAKIKVNDFQPDEPLFHFQATIDGYTFDIFSCDSNCYLCAPDTDVNTLCWMGDFYCSWMSFGKEEEEFYGVSLSEDAIIERCLKKEAVALTKDWESEDDCVVEHLEERMEKMKRKGWKILGM